MRYFLDTEFIESGRSQPIHLISIGIVAEDGREFYGINSECPLEDANNWVKDNVLPYLDAPGAKRGPLPILAAHIGAFVGGFQPEDKPEFWGYYADYDWVVFCQIFGRMVDLPKGYPMYCRDLKQWADQLGNPRLPAQNSTEHNALNDARWNREVFDFLLAREVSLQP